MTQPQYFRDALGRLLCRFPDGRIAEVMTRQAQQAPLLSDSNPGFAGGYIPGKGVISPTARENDLLSRLPDADVRGEKGIAISHVSEEIKRPLQHASQNNRGNSVIITPVNTVSAVQSQMVVESPKNGGNDAEAISVVLGREQVNQTDVTPSGANLFAEYICLLEWTIGNAYFNAEIDWDNGKVLTVPATWVRATVQCTTVAVGTQITEKLSAGLAYGYSSNTKANGAKRTLLANLTASGGASPSATFAIPPFATHIGLVGRTPPAVAPAVIVQFFGAATSITMGYTTATNSGGAQNEDMFVIPNRTQFVTVLNTDAANAISLALVFGLAI